MALKLKYLTQPILAHFTSNTQQKFEPNKNETGSMGGHLKSSRVQKFHFWKSLQRSRLRMFTLKASERLWVVDIALQSTQVNPSIFSLISICPTSYLPIIILMWKDHLWHICNTVCSSFHQAISVHFNNDCISCSNRNSQCYDVLG